MEKHQKEDLHRWSLPTCDGASPIYYGDDPTTQDGMIPLIFGLDWRKISGIDFYALIKERFGLEVDSTRIEFIVAKSAEEVYEKIAAFNKAMVLASLELKGGPIRDTFKVPGVVNIQDLCYSDGVIKWEEKFAQMPLKRLS